MVSVSEELRDTYHEDVDPDTEGPVLSVLDEVVVVKVIDEKTHLETEVGIYCIKNFKRLSECPRWTK